MPDRTATLAAANSRALITPEGIALTLELAPVGQRLWAFVIDLAIIVAVLVIMTLLALFVAGSLVLSGPALGNDAVLQTLAIIWLLGAFVLRNLWFILFESGRHTATPGKRVMGIRVVARDGGRLTTDAVVARNLLRELEFFLPLSFIGYETGTGAITAWTALAGIGWSLGFALLPVFNRDRLRIGDLVAGTWVLRTPRRRLGADIAQHSAAVDQSAFIFTEAQLAAYGEYELQTLENILRRGNPNPMRRPADDPLIIVAAAIRSKIGYPGGDDYAFLAAYYAALRARLERGMLFGRRRRDKRDDGQNRG
ncbi:MAG: RDD family protein [Sandarakinorhabdus sp.]